jgi:hypothetical protein
MDYLGLFYDAGELVELERMCKLRTQICSKAHRILRDPPFNFKCN